MQSGRSLNGHFSLYARHGSGPRKTAILLLALVSRGVLTTHVRRVAFLDAHFIRPALLSRFRPKTWWCAGRPRRFLRPGPSHFVDVYPVRQHSAALLSSQKEHDFP